MGRGQELLDAARKGDGRTVTKILTLITKRSGPFTSLRRGAGVNVQDDNGYTPLHHACMNGHRDIVHLLLSVDASPCVVDKKGATPLHLAAFKGDSDVVSMLLNHSNPPVNIDQKTNDQETALVIASQFGFNDVVTQLIARGADVTLRNNKEESALDLAAQYGKLDVVEQLINARPQLLDPYRFPISRGRSFPTTPLHRASMNGHKEVVAYLIRAGIDPNIRTDNGTALHEGVRYLSASVVKVLLSLGADLKAKDRQGQTVQSLLSTYPEEATRRVKRVIREYENKIKNAYESEEDPVQDYSPTGYVNTPGMFRVFPTLGTTNIASTNDVVNRNVVNLCYLTKNNSLPLAKRLSKKLKKCPSANLITSTDDVAQNCQIYSNSQQHYVNHNMTPTPDSAEIHYDNVTIVFPVNDQHDGVESLNGSQNSLKKRPPKPPPKPLIQSKQPSVIWLNELMEKLNSKGNSVHSEHSDDNGDEQSEIDGWVQAECDDYFDAEQILEDVIYENMPDDEKAKRQIDSGSNSECIRTQTNSKTFTNMGYVGLTGDGSITEEAYREMNCQGNCEKDGDCNCTEIDRKRISNVGYIEMTGNFNKTKKAYEKIKHQDDTELNSECNYTQMNGESVLNMGVVDTKSECSEINRKFSNAGYVEMTGNCSIIDEAYEKIKRDDVDFNTECNYIQMNKKLVPNKGYVEMTGNCRITGAFKRDYCHGDTDLNSECNYIQMNRKSVPNMDVVETKSECSEMNSKFSNTGYVEMTGNCSITDEAYEKIKRGGVDYNTEYNYIQMNKKFVPNKGYVEMTGNCRITGAFKRDNCHGDTEFNSECNYIQMNRKSVPNIGCADMKSIYSTTEDVYIAMDKRNVAKRLSLGDIKYHWKGDEGCLFGTSDYTYLYVLNKKLKTDDVSPFIKEKLKVDRMPCLCPRNMMLSKDSEESSDELYFFINKNNIYNSITDINADELELGALTKHVGNTPKAENDNLAGKEYVPFKKDTSPSKSGEEPMLEKDTSISTSSKQSKLSPSAKKRLSKTFRKKIVQAKRLITDWKAPETQKNTNINLSLSPSSSSLTNNHQSFVKKIATKCLGLKAKFSSAPNISNSSGLDSEISAKSQNTDQKSNTNTLLIGNSKFFNKILSKKEESGEIVCNDEFDTISLDRLGTLNRDSTVNRSNRSCPGFKNSLPNISENAELSDSESIVITEIDCDVPKQQTPKEAINLRAKFSIFEPRDSTVISNDSSEILNDSADLVNECYETCGFSENEVEKTKENNNYMPKPKPRVNVAVHSSDEGVIYENVNIVNRTVPPTPAVRNNIPSKILLDEVQRKALYENISILKENKEDNNTLSDIDQHADGMEARNITKKPPISRSSTLSSDSMEDESNLEDILLSEKSKSFKRGEKTSFYPSKLNVSKSVSNASNVSEFTEVSAIENVDCSEDIYTTMTGTLPHKTNKNPENKKKVLFRHKTFTNIEVDRNSHTTPNWHNEFMKETLANYHIRGTGHCIYKAPTVQEFIYIFNRETLYSDTPPFTKVPNENRESYFETAICFCKPTVLKHHKSAEDLLELPLDNEVVEDKVTIDLNALQSKREMISTSFRCFCDSRTCTFHTKNRESPNHLVVKFSAVKRSISTPDITLDSSLTTVNRSSSLKYPQEIHYAVTNIEDIVLRNKKIATDNPKSPAYTSMSHPSTISSSTDQYSIKDIADVISLNSHSESADASPVCALNSMHLPLRKSTSSEYSGRWTLASCNSNTTVQSDTSFKTCFEDPEEDSDDGTLHSDEDSSDAETVKSDVSSSKRPWVHSNSFNFGNNGPQIKNYAILEEDSSSDQDSLSKFESPSKIESGISVEGSESSSSECEEDSGVPRVDAVSLGVASLERDAGCGGVRSGSGRRRWDETEVTSEGDALSVSSAASSCAPHHLVHHHDYSKVSPTPPKKPPRRNLSVSPTHANSPSSGYSYELRTHARSQDDLDEIQGAKHYLKHGRSVDQYVDGKLSYSEFEENHNSPRVAPVPNPRPSLKQRPQPVAITAMYENVVIKEQNPRRKLRRNNFGPQGENNEPRMEDRVRKYSNQDRSSLESLLDDQSMNSPSDCERYYDGPRVDIPLSPTHYEQPPTPDHPPPTPKQAENSIHERIRPLSQEYKRRSMLRDSQTETEYLLRAMSVASVASGATDRSGNTDNCVEEYVCDVPFAGLFKGSTTTLDGIGLRPMPAERPKTLRKLKSVYDASPTEQTSVNISSLSSNGQGTERNLNGCEDEVRRRSNTTSSTHSGDKSLSILSPFDEQEEWAKISEIMASFGSKLVRESVFVSELEQEFTNRLGLSCSESSLSPSVASNLGLWLSGMGLHDYEPLFLESGFDDVDFVNGILDENDLREMGIEENDRQRILESAKQLPLKITEISNNYNNNNISKNQNESVEEWLRNINLEIYSDTFRKHLYVDMDRVRRIWEVELTAVLEIQKAGHRKRILASVSGEHNGPANHMGDINADLNSLKNNIKQLKDDIKEKLPISENLKPVPPPVVPTLAPPGGETLKRSKKNRPAPQPPRPSDLEIRAPSELLVGVPGALKTQWKHQPFVLVTGAVTYVANYLGSTVVKELRGTESTKKSIQKLKKSTKEPRDSPDIILSISYRGVKFLNTITRELICEHEIRNIHCACQDADDLTHFAYITKDHTTKSHYCHVFRVATMDQATEVILTLGEAFEVAYQMALREQSNRYRVTQSQAKTPTHDPMTTTNKEKPNVNHGRSHSITEIKLNGHQLKIAPMPASLSNEDFQAARNSDGTRSPRTPLLKAPIASTEEL